MRSRVLVDIEDSPQSGGERVVLIDDSGTDLERARLILQREGYEVCACTSSAMGIRECIRLHPDLVILDLNLPQISGLEVARLLRKQPEFDLTPILMLTGEPDAGRRSEALRAGMDGYLPKPCDPTDLASVSRATLARSQRARRYISTDSLTGAYTRDFAEERIRQEINRATRNDAVFSIVLFDLDRFKSINDTWGHLVGDRALKQFSSVIRANTRSYHPFCRLGGDEFLLIINDLPRKFIHSLYRRLQRLFADNPVVFEHEGDRRTIHISCSAGIATFPTEGENLQDLMHAADQAMYQSKSAGGNRITIPRL